MDSTFHDAHAAVQKEQIATLKRRSTPEGRDPFAWKDPLRDFETMGQFVPPELRHWLSISVESRLQFIANRKLTYYTTAQLDGETPQNYFNRLKIVWRDLAFIVGEELKTWVRPELVGRGSREVIAMALDVLVPKENVKSLVKTKRTP